MEHTCGFAAGSFACTQAHSKPKKGIRSDNCFPLVCLKCSYHWKARTPEPAACPACHNRFWNKPRVELKCTVCSYTWATRTQDNERPRRCPECHSTRWMDGADLRKDHGVHSCGFIWSSFECR